MNSITEKLESLPAEEKKLDIWKLAMAIALDNSGSACCDDMFYAVSYYLGLGFTPEEICSQINFFETWNVDAEEIKDIFDIKGGSNE